MTVTITSDSDNSNVRYKVVCKGWEKICTDLMDLHGVCEDCDSLFPMQKITIEPFLAESEKVD